VTFRLGYLVSDYPHAAYTFIQREAAALRDLGHHVQTFSIRPPEPGQMLDDQLRLESAATIYLLPTAPWTLAAAHLRLLLTNPLRYFNALIAALSFRPPGFQGVLKQLAYFAEAGLLARQMRRRQLTHLHNHFCNSSCSVALIASELGGFTFSFTVHGPTDFVDTEYWRLDEKIRRAVAVNCISQFAREKALQSAAPDEAGKLRIVHCGVELAEFDPPNSKTAGARLLFIGRLAKAKGLHFLLRAFAEISQSQPDATLTLAGDGPERPALEKQAADLGVASRVRFLGYQSQTQIRGELAAADVFVMTSLAEGLPVVVMEAMAAGAPVVAPNIAGIPELIEDRVTGLLTPTEDSHATASAVLKLLGDGSLRQSLVQAARAKVQTDFNIRHEAGWFARILESAEAGQSEPNRPASSPSPCTQGEGRGGRGEGSSTSENPVEKPKGDPHPNPLPEYMERGPEAVARSDRRFLLISPCRNEAQYMRRTLESVVAQSTLPALWIIVDDGSTDATPAILSEYAAKYPFIRVLRREDRGFRQLGGGVIDAFYAGLESVRLDDFDYLCKLDLDLVLPPRYFQTLMEKMESELRLGACSGKTFYQHPRTGRFIAEPCGDEQAIGASKFYRVKCFQQIGGFVRELMWDGIDGHRCRMVGWMAMSCDDPRLNFEHLRPMGTSDKNWWTGRKRHGQGQYFMGTSFLYLLASCVYRLGQPPVVIGAIASFWGYVQSAIQRRPRYGDEEFRRFLRRWQWNCLIKGKAAATAELDRRQELARG
jgi:glycosyltransferase involved in cell wall biosynthesis